MWPGLGHALGTASPIRDLGLVDLEPLIVGRGEARGRSDRAIDVDHAAADPADQMMVVVADAILEAGWRADRLDTPEQPFLGQQAEGVVDRLEGDGADLGPHHFRHAVGGDVGLTSDGTQDGQSLGRDLDAVLTEKIAWVGGHADAD